MRGFGQAVGQEGERKEGSEGGGQRWQEGTGTCEGSGVAGRAQVGSVGSAQHHCTLPGAGVRPPQCGTGAFK